MPLCRLGTHPAPSLLPGHCTGTGTDPRERLGWGHRSGGLFPHLSEGQKQTGGVPVTTAKAVVQSSQHKELPLCHCWGVQANLVQDQVRPCSLPSPQNKRGSVPLQLQNRLHRAVGTSTSLKGTVKTLPCRRGKSRWIPLCLVHH